MKRAEALVEQRYVSEDELLALQTELEAARSDASVAEADRRVAARNVEKCMIVAPFDGVVVERLAQVGALASPGEPLLRVIDLAAPEVEASIQAEAAQALREASDIVFESQGRRYPLQLLRFSPVIERAGRTRVARFAFAAERAPAGSSGAVTWRAPGQHLPASLLVKRGEQLGYFIARDGRALFVAAPGAQEGRSFPVELDERAVLVVGGHQGLNDGDAIVDANLRDASMRSSERR